MATSKRDTLIVGLRNVHALEGQAISMMENVRSRLQHYPDFENVVVEHIEQSRDQQQRVERCLHRHGDEPSSLKAAALKLAGNMQAMLHTTASDEVLKNLFTLHAFENFEIASYLSLIELAQLCDDGETAQTCRGILEQEESTARKLRELVGPVTRAYAELEESGATSRR